MAARSNPSSQTELTVVMYIIYTNLQPKTDIITSSNKISIPSANVNVRLPNSFKSAVNINQIRDRASTMLVPPVRTNVVTPIRADSTNAEQNIGNNIPLDRNVEYFKYRTKRLSLISDKTFVSLD